MHMHELELLDEKRHDFEPSRRKRNTSRFFSLVFTKYHNFKCEQKSSQTFKVLIDTNGEQTEKNEEDARLSFVSANLILK
jgi:hypothetical protein